MAAPLTGTLTAARAVPNVESCRVDGVVGRRIVYHYPCPGGVPRSYSVDDFVAQPAELYLPGHQLNGIGRVTEYHVALDIAGYGDAWDAGTRSEVYQNDPVRQRHPRLATIVTPPASPYTPSHSVSVVGSQGFSTVDLTEPPTIETPAEYHPANDYYGQDGPRSSSTDTDQANVTSNGQLSGVYWESRSSSRPSRLPIPGPRRSPTSTTSYLSDEPVSIFSAPPPLHRRPRAAPSDSDPTPLVRYVTASSSDQPWSQALRYERSEDYFAEVEEWAETVEVWEA